MALTEADATTDVFEGHPGGAFSKVFRWSFEKQGLYQPAGAPRPVTQPGAPPDVDLYIDDGRCGEYMPFLADFRGAAEIWNRTAADGRTATKPQRSEFPTLPMSVSAIGAPGRLPVSLSAVFSPGLRRPHIWPTDWKATDARHHRRAEPHPIRRFRGGRTVPVDTRERRGEPPVRGERRWRPKQPRDGYRRPNPERPAGSVGQQYRPTVILIGK